VSAVAEAGAVAARPWRIMPVWAALVALIGIGAAGGYAAARAHYESKLAKANRQIGALSAANTTLGASVAKQNGAVVDLQAEADRRKQEAAQAWQQARDAAAQYQRTAQALLLTKPPPGADECTAARAAFDDELRAERGEPL